MSSTENGPVDYMRGVINGEFDDQLDVMINIIRQRKSIVAAHRTSALRPGDQVRFVDGVRPQYLAGLIATVVRVGPKVVVTCDDPRAGRFGRGEVRVPGALLVLA